jgi:hypothetical protein
LLVERLTANKPKTKQVEALEVHEPLEAPFCIEKVE